MRDRGVVCVRNKSREMGGGDGPGLLFMKSKAALG